MMSKSELYSAAYSIDERAMKLLCQYDYPGNIRALRNLIYEVTSFINEGEAISEELVHLTLAKLKNRNELAATHSGSSRKELSVNMVTTVPESLLASVAQPGDFILPLVLYASSESGMSISSTARARPSVMYESYIGKPLLIASPLLYLRPEIICANPSSEAGSLIPARFAINLSWAIAIA